MTAIQLNRYRRRVQDELTECQKKLITKQLDKELDKELDEEQNDEEQNDEEQNNFNNPRIPQLCQSIDRHGPLNSSLEFINQTNTMGKITRHVFVLYVIVLLLEQNQSIG